MTLRYYYFNLKYGALITVYVSLLGVKFQYVNWVGNKFISAYIHGKNLNLVVYVAAYIMYDCMKYAFNIYLIRYSTAVSSTYFAYAIKKIPIQSVMQLLYKSSARWTSISNGFFTIIIR